MQRHDSLTMTFVVIVSILMLFQTAALSDFPSCSEDSFSIQSDTFVRVNVSDYLEVGAVATDCDDGICESAHQFQTISSYNCSVVCAKSGDCEWWTATQIFESLHLNRTICSLFKNEGTTSIPGVRSSNSTSGHRSCSPSLWPLCLEKGVFIERNGYSELWVNAHERFGLPVNDPSCYNSSCVLTDSFRVHNIEHCTAICSRTKECKFWSATKEDLGLSCWLRRDRISISNNTDAVSGNKTCAHHAPFFKLH